MISLLPQRWMFRLLGCCPNIRKLHQLMEILFTVQISTSYIRKHNTKGT